MWIFYFWSTKKKKKLTNISLTKLALTLISTEIFPHLSGCTDCNTLPPPQPPPRYTLIPSQREWGESSSFRHAGGTWVCWKWGREGGKRYFLLSAQRSCHLTNSTNSLCQPILPSSAHHLFYRVQKQSSPWITPNQGFLFSPAFWQTTAKKSLWWAITVDSCISR